MAYAKCTPFDPLFIGVISPEGLIFYWKFRNFYHLSRKDPPFSVLKHPISPKDPTENSLIFVTKRRPFLFLVDFVTERPLLFKCPMYVSRAVASLTVLGGQEFHFPHFSSNLDQVFLLFFKLFSFSFLILALRVGKSPTREGPGYATVRLFIQIVCPGISPSPLYSLPVNFCLSHWCLA